MLNAVARGIAPARHSRFEPTDSLDVDLRTEKNFPSTRRYVGYVDGRSEFGDDRCGLVDRR